MRAALTDSLRAMFDAYRAGVPPRECALCGTVLAPGYAAPILEPDCREGPPEANWACLDGRSCDLRAARKLRDAAPDDPAMGWLLGRLAATVRPEPPALPAGEQAAGR